MPTKFQFGDFLLDTDEECLYRDGEKVSANRRTLQVLRLLIERRGTLVTKQDFFDTVWANSFVEDANLSVTIAGLRKALGDDSKQPKFIENIPRKGYRFIADVRTIREDGLNETVAEATPADASSVDTALASVDSALASPSQKAHTRPPAFHIKHKILLATAFVLFATVLIVFGYKGLVREPGKEFWANIPSDLNSHFSEKEKKYIESHGTDDREAYLHYLKGRYYWDRREEKIGESYYDKAVDEFKLAIEKDPTFALPYTGVANALGQMSSGSKNTLPNGERYRVVTSYLRKAIEIDPTLSEAHASLGMNELFLAPKPQWATAEREYRKALDLDPTNAQARHWLAEYLAITGKFDESLSEYDKAIELDPLSMAVRGDKCYAYMFARRHDEAVRCIEEVRSLDPNFKRTYWYALIIYMASDRLSEALDTWPKVDNGENSVIAKEYESKLRAAFRAEGNDGFWRIYLEFSSKFGGPGKPMALAKVGDKDAAFAALEKWVEGEGGSVAYIKVWPLLDSLYDDSRWPKLLREVGLEP